MKTLVLYASKYGCTEDCSKYLKSKISEGCDLFNLKNPKEIDLHQYDQIIIGSPIYIGKIRKEAKSFCEQNLETLLAKKIALFICCTTPDEAEDFFKKNFPPELLSHSLKNADFGGELRQAKMGFFDKKLTGMIAKTAPKTMGIAYENIDLLASLIN